MQDEPEGKLFLTQNEPERGSGKRLAARVVTWVHDAEHGLHGLFTFDCRMVDLGIAVAAVPRANNDSASVER